MPEPTVAAAGEEAPDAADGMAERHRHGEVIRAAHEIQPTEPREDGAREQRAEKATEEDEADREVGPEAELAPCVVLPAEHDEQRLRADDRAGEQRPHGGPELVLRDPDPVAVALEPEHGGHAAGGSEGAPGGRHHTTGPPASARA